MTVDVVTGVQAVSGENDSIFLLVGNGASLSLTSNTDSSIFMVASTQHLILGGSNSNENVFIYGSGDEISVTGGLTGLTNISGFSNSNEFLDLDFPAPLPANVQSDNKGGTLVTLNNGAKLDFLGDPNVAVVAEFHGTTQILGNVLHP